MVAIAGIEIKSYSNIILYDSSAQWSHARGNMNFFNKILNDAKNDPKLKNTLDIDAILKQERERHISGRDMLRATKEMGLGGGAGGAERTKKARPRAAPKAPRPQAPLGAVAPDGSNRMKEPKKNLEIVSKETLDILKAIDPPLPKNLIKELHGKLAGFYHIEDLNELRLGRYIRWIRDDDLYSLKPGGTLVEVKFCSTGTILAILSFFPPRNVYHVVFDKSIVFQKMIDDEL